jgi:hypothetical protein
MSKKISRTVGGALATLGIGAMLAACGSGPNAIGDGNSAPAKLPAASAAITSSGPVYVETQFSPNPLQRPAQYIMYEHTEVDGITWSSWGGQTAQGNGDLSNDDCNPDCGTGHMDNYPAHIVFSDIQTVNGKQEYTRYTVTFAGQDQHPALAQALTNQPTTKN